MPSQVGLAATLALSAQSQQSQETQEIVDLSSREKVGSLSYHDAPLNQLRLVARLRWAHSPNRIQQRQWRDAVRGKSGQFWWEKTSQLDFGIVLNAVLKAVSLQHQQNLTPAFYTISQDNDR